jgi:hypothetical protein
MGISTDFIVKNGIQANSLIQTTANVQANQIISTAPQGTAPFTVSSNTLVVGLNAQFLNGQAGGALPSLTTNNTWTGYQNFNQAVAFNINATSGGVIINSTACTAPLVYASSSNTNFEIQYQGSNGFVRNYIISRTTDWEFWVANSTGGFAGAVEALSIGLINGNVTIGGTQTTFNSNINFTGLINTFNGLATFNNTATFQSTTQFNSGASITGNLSLTLGTSGSINSSIYTGTANSAAYLGTVAANGYLVLATNNVITGNNLIINNVANAETDIVFQGNGVNRATISTNNTHALALQFANTTGGMFNALTLDSTTGNVVIGGGNSVSINSNTTFAAGNVAFNVNSVSFSGNVFLTNPLNVPTLSVGNSTVNATINSTFFTGVANAALSLNGATNFAQVNVVNIFTANQTIVGVTTVVDNNIQLQSNTLNANIDFQVQGTAGLLRHILRSTNTQFLVLYANTTGVLQSLPAVTYDLNTGNTTQYSPVFYSTNASITANAITFQPGQYLAWSSNVSIGATSGTGFTVNVAAAGSVNFAANGTTWLTSNNTVTNFSNTILENPQLQCYKETLTTNTITTNTYSISLSSGNFYQYTLSNASITFAFTNPPATGNAFSFTLVLTQNSTGGAVVTWPSSVKFTNNTTPTLQAGASKSDILTFFTINGGTTYAATYAIANTAI